MGRAALRGVSADPQLTLEALIVHNPEKVGRDAATFFDSSAPTGVIATDDHSVLDHVDAIAHGIRRHSS